MFIFGKSSPTHCTTRGIPDRHGSFSLSRARSLSLSLSLSVCVCVCVCVCVMTPHRMTITNQQRKRKKRKSPKSRRGVVLSRQMALLYALTYVYADTHTRFCGVHPFREGNGRGESPPPPSPSSTKAFIKCFVLYALCQRSLRMNPKTRMVAYNIPMVCSRVLVKIGLK